MSSFLAPSARPGHIVLTKRIDLPRPRDDRKNRDKKCGEHRRHDADTEPNDQDRHHRDLRNRVEADHHGIEAAIDRSRPADDDAEHDAERHRKGKAGERRPQRNEGVFGERERVLADGLEYLHRRGQHKSVDVEDTADEFPQHEHADGEQPRRKPFQGYVHGHPQTCVRSHALRTSAILARNSWTMSVKCGSKQMSRSRGRGRSILFVRTMCPGRALMT